MILAIFASDLSSAFVQHAGQDDIATETDAAAAGRMNGEIRSGKIEHRKTG